MNIGIDVKTLSKRYTGIAVYVCEIIRYFNELDTEDQFYLYSNKEIQLPFLLKDNFHIIVYSSKIGSFGVLFYLPKLLKKYGIDVFWGPEHIVPLLPTKCKIVVTIHDLAVLVNPQLGTKFNAFLQRVFTIPSVRRADKVVAISKSTASDVLKYANIGSDKIQVIYNGDSPYNKSIHEFADDEALEIINKYSLVEPYFLFVGTIEPRKNIPTIVKAFDLFKKQYGGNEKLVLAGGLGWRYKKTIESINNSPYKNDIVLTGYCSALEKEYFYKNAIALLFPSLYEGFGLPILESFSLGTPVITARNSSLEEVGGVYAEYIDDALDSIGLKDKMYTVYCQNKKEKSSEYQAWASHFSRKECAREMLNLFKNMVKL